MQEKNTPLITSERIQDLFTGIAKLITSSLEISTITTAIMEQVELFFQPHNWSLFRLDAETNELYFFVTKGIDIDKVKHVRLRLGEGIAGLVAETGKSMLVQDAQSDSRFSNKIDNVSGFETRSLIAVPIIFQQKVMGVIEIINLLEDRNFNRRELEMLEAIADFSAIAFSNAMAYERIVWVATHDPLTGLYNRAHLDHIESLYNQSTFLQHNHGMPDDLYSVAVLVDINDFKGVNDNHGHIVGDQVLIKAAKLLQSHCSQHDYAFRIGGDEFLLLMMNLHKNDIAPLLRNLKNKLKMDSANLAPAPGMSFGVAAGLTVNLEHLIKEADDQMYMSKASSKSLLSQKF